MRRKSIPARSASTTPEKPQVVYVLGAGKSGSTILGVTLGNCQDMFFTGELFSWLVEGGTPVLEGTERAEFWEQVREHVDGVEGLFGNEVVRLLERSLAPFRVHRMLARRRLRPKYRSAMLSLFSTISQTAGARFVIDTSHFPMRARELQGIEGIDLYLLFLRRDPRVVVASYSRHVRARTLRRALLVLSTNADLWLTYLLAVLVFLRHPRDRRMLVRYEDFLADPSIVLRDILDGLGSSAPIPDLDHLITGYALRGNRLLLSDSVSFHRRGPGRAPRSLVTGILQMPWMLLLPRLRPAVALGSPEAERAVADREHGRQ